MTRSIHELVAFYQAHKELCLCLDIETCFFNGPISVVGIYKPLDGQIDYTPFINGSNLLKENLKTAFKNCRMLITYNGLKHDIPKIRTEFPNVLPFNILVLDLYLLAQKLGLGTNLITLENTLRVDRSESIARKRKAVQMWQAYKKYNDRSALNKLIEYNRQDTINLYPLLEALIKRIK